MSLRRGGVARALGIIAASAVAGAPLGSQVVRGVVSERASNAPLAGVLLSVVDERGATAVQALSDDRGAFDIRLPGAGRFSLDAKRIGVRHIRLAPFTIAAGETRRIDVEVEPLPAVLSSVQITGRTSCVRRPESNARTAALWDDARTALTAAVISRSLTGGRDTVVRFTRKLDAATWRVLYEDRRRVSASLDRPFRSLPAQDLSAGGYVRENADGSTDYYAPDADVLLSETFLADHCFRIEPGVGERAGYVGLAFEPVPKRKTPDIKGVLWMDANTAELRTLEFTYTWLPNDQRVVDFGGTVSFFRMPGGRWLVRSWRIRMPEFGHERYAERFDGTLVSLGRSTRPQLVRISEEGGAVPLDMLLNQAGHVHGTVVLDSTSNRPLAGITVALEGTGDSTTTAMDGSFDLPFVAPGSYTVVLRHPALDSLGIQHLARTVDVEAGSSAALGIRFPSNDELAARLCKATVDFSHQAVIRFLVVDRATGTPLANTPAILSRVPLGAEGKPVADSAASYDVTLDARGGFLACALSSNEIVRIESAPESATPWMQTIRPRAGMIGWHLVRVGRER